jgi:protease II
MKHGSNEWIPHGAFLKSWIMPPGSIQWINVASGHTITNDKGRQTLYLCAPHKRPVQIHHIAAGDFEPSPWNKWFDQPFQSFMIRTPEEHPYVFYAASNSTVHKKWRPPFDKKVTEDFGTFKSTLHKAKSADGTEVSYLMVHLEKVKPKAILCYVYSAYGMSTIVGWPHNGWGPLLRRGFAIVYCYARGGGDNDYAWMEAGQREKHIRTIEDFEATIRAAQKLVHVGPDKTIIFGRSAGGMMVGATTARHPDGDLMGATFTEVPFVDVLRTSTNPKLPLTTSGISEYGNIEKSPVNFQAALELSPIDTLPSDGAPGVFVLGRTGLRDLQVMPFEPVKFIERLRGTKQSGPGTKFLGIEEDETHSYSSKTFLQTRAKDLAILLDWAFPKIKSPV